MPRTRCGLALPLLLALAMAACKPGAPAEAPASVGPVTTPPASTVVEAPGPATADVAPDRDQTACPDADFPSFLERFESSADVQRASTAKVVTMDSIDGNAQPEPREITRQVPRTEITFPIMLDPARRKQEGLEATVTEIGPVEREVKHGVPDSGVQVRFNFQATPCWTLVRVSDDTI